MMKNIIKDRRVVIGIALILLFLAVAGTVLWWVNSRDTVFELPPECLIIDEYGNLTGIENKPSGKYSLTIPDNVIEIGYRSFEGDEDLLSVKFSNTLQSVGAYAFSNCVNLKEVDMSNADWLKSIGGYVFGGCTSLESVIFSYEVPLMGDYAFKDCASIKELEFPDKISTLGTGIFLNCTGLRTVKFSENQEKIYSGMFEGCSSLKSVYLPQAVEIIETGAFKNCTSLEGIELPDKLRIIASDAFYGCSSLKGLDIPESATAVYDAFDGCNALLETENGISYVDGWAVNIAEETEQVVFREGTVGIAHGMNCPNVKSVYIPSSVKWVSDTFRESRTLTDLVFADNSGVENIYHYAFFECTALEKIDFGKNSSLSSFGWLCFSGCTSLKSVIIPASVEQIGNAFENCPALENMEFE